jgi:general stress protein YciG
MADNQDKGTNQGGMPNTDTNKTGQQGGQGAGGDMAHNQQGGQHTGKNPEDKMNKDWDQSKDTGRQGGRTSDDMTHKEKPADAGRMGGQQWQDDDQQKDQDR